MEAYLRSLPRRIMRLPARSATALAAVLPSISGTVRIPANAAVTEPKSKRIVPVVRIRFLLAELTPPQGVSVIDFSGTGDLSKVLDITSTATVR